MTPERTLDEILALQVTVAWAGEGRCEPPRLGWWSTDLVDPEGGGDFFARLLPKTGAWAALQAVREAARKVDAEARSRTGRPDDLRTLFFLGFDLDELLDDRLASLKREGALDGLSPAETLTLPYPIGPRFDRDALAEVLSRAGAPRFQRDPAGRRLTGTPPSDPAELARTLAAALVPFGDAYPLPHYAVRG